MHSRTAIIDSIIYKYRAEIIEIINQVESALNSIKMRNIAEISSIYTRPKSFADLPIKSPDGIANALLKLGEPANHDNIFNCVQDIIGFTVAINYKDQVKHVVDDIIKSLSNDLIAFIEIKKHAAKNGYYAQHLIFQYKNNIDQTKIYIEIQCKTILHDAWSRKMHDLTYKPEAGLDSRVAGLMQSIADTLENLEHQSVLIRNIISQPVGMDRESKRVIADIVVKAILDFHMNAMPSNEIDQVYDIKNSVESDWIISEDSNSEKLKKVFKNIIEVEGKFKNRGYGYKLLARIAAFRPESEFKRRFRIFSEEFLEIMTNQDPISDESRLNLMSIPIIREIIDGPASGVETIDYILNNFELDRGDVLRLRLNRACFITELHYFNRSLPDRQAAQESSLHDIEAFSNICAAGYEDEPALVDAVTALNTGFHTIVFGQTMDDIQSGIQKCHEASRFKTSEDTLNMSYLRYYERLGWRRCFELEALPPKSGSS